MEFDHINVVRNLLQRLASSPLVRQTLPNAATCQQYFSKREAGEAMNTFLVREVLGYSEFVGALLLLYEDKKGVQQHEKQPSDGWTDWWYDASDDPEQEQLPGAAASPTSATRPTASSPTVHNSLAHPAWPYGYTPYWPMLEVAASKGSALLMNSCMAGLLNSCSHSASLPHQAHLHHAIHHAKAVAWKAKVFSLLQQDPCHQLHQILSQHSCEIPCLTLLEG